jgi:hypothetical protein
MRISKIAMGALAAGMTFFAAAAAVALPSNANGYMVEVHTCKEDDAGTDSTIDMSLDIRDVNWKIRHLGPWRQNICRVNGNKYDDHEYNQWDRYFFPEPKGNKAYHIETLFLTSDGKGNKRGWCWDVHYVTYIEDGNPIWTWAWEFKSPWIYEGTYPFPGDHFDEDKKDVRAYPGFTYGTTGRTIQSDVHIVTAEDQDDNCSPPPQPYGDVNAVIVIDAYTTNCGTGRFWLEGLPQEVRGEYNPGGHCYYRAYFTKVNPGVYKVAFDGYNACDSTTVTAGRRSNVELVPFRWNCR